MRLRPAQEALERPLSGWPAPPMHRSTRWRTLPGCQTAPLCRRLIGIGRLTIVTLPMRCVPTGRCAPAASTHRARRSRPLAGGRGNAAYRRDDVRMPRGYRPVPADRARLNGAGHPLLSELAKPARKRGTTAPRPRKTSASAELRMAILVRDQMRCTICGIALTNHDRSLPTHGVAGHIIARINGGTLDPRNLRAECQRCSRYGGGLLRAAQMQAQGLRPRPAAGGWNEPAEPIR